MGGPDVHAVGKGWFIAALLCIACTLTGIPAYLNLASAAIQGFNGDVLPSAVWDLMMCSACKAADKETVSNHVQDIFAA